jgi:hypothetical protein
MSLWWLCYRRSDEIEVAIVGALIRSPALGFRQGKRRSGGGRCAWQRSLANRMEGWPARAATKRSGAGRAGRAGRTFQEMRARSLCPCEPWRQGGPDLLGMEGGSEIGAVLLGKSAIGLPQSETDARESCANH